MKAYIALNELAMAPASPARLRSTARPAPVWPSVVPSSRHPEGAPLMHRPYQPTAVTAFDRHAGEAIRLTLPAAPPVRALGDEVSHAAYGRLRPVILGLAGFWVGIVAVLVTAVR